MTLLQFESIFLSNHEHQSIVYEQTKQHTIMHEKIMDKAYPSILSCSNGLENNTNDKTNLGSPSR